MDILPKNISYWLIGWIGARATSRMTDCIFYNSTDASKLFGNYRRWRTVANACRRLKSHIIPHEKWCTLCNKKQDSWFLIVTWTDVDQFSKFLHRQISDLLWRISLVIWAISSEAVPPAASVELNSAQTVYVDVWCPARQRSHNSSGNAVMSVEYLHKATSWSVEPGCVCGWQSLLGAMGMESSANGHLTNLIPCQFLQLQETEDLLI